MNSNKMVFLKRNVKYYFHIVFSLVTENYSHFNEYFEAQIFRLNNKLWKCVPQNMNIKFYFKTIEERMIQ